MFRSLRKGRSSVYFQHEHTGHTIGADQFACQVVNRLGVLQFRLRPSGPNEPQDAECTLDTSIQHVEIDDAHVIEGLSSYVRSQRQPVVSWSIEILTHRGPIRHSVQLAMADAFTLRFTVIPRA